MKKKFSKILGVGLTLALLFSLLLTAAPVSANVTSATVTPSDAVISHTAAYTILFTIDEELATTDDIVIVFDDLIDIGSITGVTVAASSGFGTGAWGPTATTSAVSTTTATDDTLTIDVPSTTGRIARVTVVVSGIVNPDIAADYTLKVSTTAETTAVESEAITIANPTIVEVPGTVRWYNAAGTPMGINSGSTPILAAIADVGEGYTIKIDPGTYTEDPVTADIDVTFESTGTAAETIIVGSWTINDAGTVIDGLTLDGDEEANVVQINAADVIIQDSVISNATILVDIDAATATVQDSTLTVAANIGIDLTPEAADDATISGNTFTVEAGGTAINIAAIADGGTVADSTFTGADGTGITVAGDTTISGNTFDGLLAALDIDGGTVAVDGNTIINSTGDAIDIAAGTVTIKLNSIIDSVGYGLNTAVAVDATFNWWGTSVAADIAAMITGAGAVVYEPFLTGTADAVLSASDSVLADTSLDARTTVGVYVVNTTTAADVILVAKYTANPEEAIADAVAFYDVYVVGTTSATDDVSLRFYAGDEDSKLYVWSRDTDMWVELTGAGFSVYGGYMYVTVDADLLERTPFAVVTPPAVAPTLDAPVIVMPAVGADDVPLRPTFDWLPVDGADGYYFQLADNPLFAPPLLMSFVGDLGRLLAVQTAYTYVPGLDDYATAYHWRVKAVSGTIGVGDLLESAWVENVFITMDEPVEPVEPVEPADIILEPTDVIVTLPPATPITPAWIYVIIGVGAVLVIALLVLIVRTRRVA